MASFLDVCRFNPTLGGTTDWTVSSAVTGYQTPASAGAINGAIYRYRAESSDLSQWEVGYGAYTVAGTVLARTVVLFNSSGTTSKISFSAAPQVAIVALGEDIVNITPPQGRITLTSVTPVMASSVTGATTVYYTPYRGCIVPIYDGSNFVVTACAELSQATTDSTKSPAAVAASKIYDLFVWNDSGTIRCTRGPAWTNATTRGYTFAMVNGILLNTSSITNGPAASRGTWVGTIASNASSTIDFIFGSAGSGGVAAVLNVWNAYNRVDVLTTVTDSGITYTYTTATVRQGRASTGNQISFVVGAQEDGLYSEYKSFSNTTTAGAFISTGIGYDTNSAFSNNYFFMTSYASITFSCQSTHLVTPAIGTHVIYALEKGDGTHANSFGNGGFAFLSMQLRM